MPILKKYRDRIITALIIVISIPIIMFIIEIIFYSGVEVGKFLTQIF